MSNIDIIAVATPAELDRFIELPVRLYKADANYVAPLMLERREALSPAKNPYFQHATTQFWLARGNCFDILWPNIAAVNNQHVFMATGHDNLTVNQVT